MRRGEHEVGAGNRQRAIPRQHPLCSAHQAWSLGLCPTMMSRSGWSPSFSRARPAAGGVGVGDAAAAAGDAPLPLVRRRFGGGVGAPDAAASACPVTLGAGWLQRKASNGVPDMSAPCWKAWAWIMCSQQWCAARQRCDWQRAPRCSGRRAGQPSGDSGGAALAPAACKAFRRVGASPRTCAVLHAVADAPPVKGEAAQERDDDWSLCSRLSHSSPSSRVERPRARTECSAWRRRRRRSRAASPASAAPPLPTPARLATQPQEQVRPGSQRACGFNWVTV